MIKTRSIKLKLSSKQVELLKRKQMKCANCWNDIVKISKEYYFENDNDWIGKNDLQKLIKGKYSLHSQTVQALTDKFCANRMTTAKLRQQGNSEIKYPYKTKKFFVIPFKSSAINRNDNGNLRLSLGKKEYLELSFNIENIKTAEIVWKNGYYLYYTYDYKTEQLPTSNNNKVGIDLGEIHSITMCDTDGSGFVISNRLGRSIKQFRNKMYAYISKRLSRCTKGSRKYKRLLKLKAKIRNKTNNQLRNLYHQATRKAINFCIEHNVSEIVLGDINGIEKNTKKKKKLKRKSRQKVSQMEYGKIKGYLKYKAEELGIEVSLVKEYYTSQICPVCRSMHKPTGRNYICKCGLKTHRDILGAWNILNKKYKVEYIKFNIKHIQPIKVSTL